MRFDWRASAVAAAAAFLLSLLIGIIAGVTFGTLILRAVLGAVVFGGGAVGVQLVMDRFLPELRQSVSGDASGETQLGSRVDIVVDDDAIDGGDFELAETTGAHSEDAESEGVLEEAGEPARALAGSPYDGVESASPDEHIEREARTSGFAPGLAADEVRTSEDADDVAELEEAEGDEDGVLEAEPVDEAEPSMTRRPEPASSSHSADEPEVLDEVEDAATEANSASGLPDIEGFSGSFADSTPVADEREETTSSGEDPGIMARAIRTVLKREE
ncbi:MAG: hypothetical protein ACOC1I_02640 [Spirochaetota bacterium]